MPSGEISRAVGGDAERIQESNRIAVGVVLGAGGFDEGGRVGWVNPSPGEGDVPNGDGSKIIGGECFIIVIAFSPRNDDTVEAFDFRAGGVTEKDIALARAMDGFAAQ